MTRAVFWNLLGTVAMVLTTLITVPIFLRYFGAERYGILATVWVALGYFSFLDFGMGQAIVSFLSRPEAQDRHAASRIFWTGVMLNVAIGVALGVVLVGTMLTARWLGWFAATTINKELFLAIPWLLVMMPIALVYPVLVGTLDARLRFKTANINQVVGGILFQTLPLLAILVFKPTLNVAIAGSVLGRLLSAAVLLLCDARALALTAPTFDGALLRRLTSFGGWVAISSGASSLLDTADRLVIGSMLGGVAAAWYSIAYNTVTRIRALV